MYPLACVSTVQIAQVSSYQLTLECDAIGLSEVEAEKYFDGNHAKFVRNTYFKDRLRIKERKKQMLFTVAKHLPEVHITQINSLHIIKKKVYSAFLKTGEPFEIVALAKSLIEIERVISEYNGWTQKLSEETLEKYGQQTEEQPVSVTF